MGHRLQASFTACVLVALAIVEQSESAGGKSPDKPPELKPLEAMVGTSTADVTVRHKSGETSKYKVTENYEWFLGGQFLRGKAERSNGDESFFLVQYDRPRKKYRFWYFGVAGMILLATFTPTIKQWEATGNL